MLSFIILFLISSWSFGKDCGPDKVYVRQQKIAPYSKKDGVHISAHDRKAHCRSVDISNYFRDGTSQKFVRINPKLKRWNKEEKAIYEATLKLVPPWLKKYSISEVLRATNEGSLNPAASVAMTRTIVIYDDFFKSTTKVDILSHEFAHIAMLDFSPLELSEFWQLSGWINVKDFGVKLPPSKLIINDSKESIAEDFANHIEVYHFNPAFLKSFNPNMFDFIDKHVKKRSP